MGAWLKSSVLSFIFCPKVSLNHLVFKNNDFLRDKRFCGLEMNDKWERQEAGNFIFPEFPKPTQSR